MTNFYTTTEQPGAPFEKPSDRTRRLRREKQDELLRQQGAYVAHAKQLRKRLTVLQKEEAKLSALYNKLSPAVDLGHADARQARDAHGGIGYQLRQMQTAIFTVNSLIAGTDASSERIKHELDNFGAVVTEEQERTILAEADALLATLKG